MEHTITIHLIPDEKETKKVPVKKDKKKATPKCLSENILNPLNLL
jgi:hypothetical protein